MSTDDAVTVTAARRDRRVIPAGELSERQLDAIRNARVPDRFTDSIKKSKSENRLRPVPGGDASTIAYGPLPPRLIAQMRDKFLERDRREKAARIKRTE